MINIFLHTLLTPSSSSIASINSIYQQQIVQLANLPNGNQKYYQVLCQNTETFPIKFSSNKRQPILLPKSNSNYLSNLIYLPRTIPLKLKKQKPSTRYTETLFRSNFLLPNIIRCYSVIMGRIPHNGKIVCVFTGIYILHQSTFS